MDQKSFKTFQKIVYEQSGISLGPHKESLVSARVGKRMRALGFEAHGDYLRYLEDDSSGDELINLIDAISTNVTSFFRESVHFDFLAREVDQWMSRGQQRFRFWSAACSSGEEPYSMAITLQETVNGRRADMRILATDISTNVLRRSMAGNYSEEKVQTVPKQLRARYFVKEADGSYAAAQTLRQMILFRRINLSSPPFPMKGPLDAVFCRNVMIYFDNSVRIPLITEITRLLKPGGFLFVGHTESLTGMISNLKVVQPSIYMKV